jgi:hypothetical protein
MAKEQDVVKLPFRITEFNEDMLVALDRNFKEIEDQLSALQLLIKHITGGGVKDLPNAAEIWKRAENINEDGTIPATSLIGQLVEEQISDAAISASKINAGFLIVSDDLWTDNSPINGEIAWNEHDLFWNGRQYTIAAGHTANKYIYWDSMATIYGSSNTMPDLSDTGFLIAINNDGEHQIVWKQAIAKKLIGEEMLAEGAVTATKIANAAIGSAAIAEAAILAAHIHEAAIQTAHIKDAAITSAKIKDIAADKITIGSATTFEPGYDPVDNHVYFQYSVNGTTGWHDTFNSTLDKYMRQKVGDNGTWSAAARIVGQDGQDGHTPVKGTDYFDGVDGQDGISSYLWIKYSADADGTNFSDTPNTYMGVAVTTTPTAPTLKTAYRWTKVVGTDGIPGEAGADGQSSYLHIKYSDDGTTFTGNGGEDVGAYIGTYIDFNQADSTNFGDYTWNKVKGEDGQDVRKFTSQPMPPYDVGDLWIGGSDGKNTLICINARATGSFVASDWGQVTEPSPSVGMGADDNCTGLWHFDGSLNSHKGISAEFDGSFSDSKWGKGVSVASPAILRIPNTDIVNPPEASINMRILNLAGSPIGGKILDVTGGFINAESSTYAVKVEISGDTGHEGELSLEDAAVQLVRVEGSGYGDDFGSATASDGVSINEYGQLALAKLADDFSYEETTEADFSTGTLSQVEAKSDGSLRLSPQISGYTADVTGSGTPISGGDNGSNTKDRAFDDDESTLWQASQTGASIKDTAYIGCDFGSGVTKHIRRVRVKIGLYVASVMLQYSDNGTSWTDAQSLTFTSGSGWFSFDIGATGAHRFWRLLAKSGPAIQAWSIAEIEMMELLPDTYFTSGYRETIIDLSGKSALGGSKIEWDATTPANTAIQIQTALSTDGGSTYGSYQACTNGGAIPGISGANLANARLKIKENLSTSDTATTPVLNSLSIELYAGYNASGSWEKAYDFTEVGTVDVIEGPVFWDDIPTGTTAVLKAAVSTDGGVTYGSYQQVFNDGKVIPGITLGMSSTGLWVKFKIELTTNDAGITPLVSMAGLGLYSANTKVYAINVSTLTGWDDIAIEWKSDRMSLIINGVEEAFIENPNRLTTLGDYTYIGCDSSGNQIGTTIDELRIDNIYQSIDKVNAWCLINSPFYTSEEFKQWPGYIKVETDGLKVYDSEGNLRVLLGSWMEDLLREYGLEIIGGRIYASLIKSGGKDAVNYIQFAPPNKLEVYGTNNEGVGYKMMEIVTELDPGSSGGSGIDFYKYSELSGYAGGLGREGNNIVLVSVYDDLLLSSVHVMGDITKTGSYSAVEPTDDYGTRLLYAAETPELLYYDRGVINLVNGEATVILDPIFLQCIEPDSELTPWQVWVESYGENGVYVAEVGEDYFKVKERNGGVSNNKVIWRLEATRKNYAGIRLMEVIK